MKKKKKNKCLKMNKDNYKLIQKFIVLKLKEQFFKKNVKYLKKISY